MNHENDTLDTVRRKEAKTSVKLRECQIPTGKKINFLSHFLYHLKLNKKTKCHIDTYSYSKSIYR